MARQKTKKWEFWFKKYESGNSNWNEYFKLTETSISASAKRCFTSKYKNYKSNGIDIIISMTGRPKKQSEISWDDFIKEELIEIAKRYNGMTKDKDKKEKNQKEKNQKEKNQKEKNQKVSSFQFSKKISVHISNFKHKKNTPKRDKEVETIILKTFHKFKVIFVRGRISAVMAINFRRFGRYMKVLNLERLTRRSKGKKRILKYKF